MNKKSFIYVGMVIIALISFVSGFCVAPLSAKASMANMNDMTEDKSMHSTKESSMMPCCSENARLGENGIVSAPLNEKMVFSFTHLSDSSTYKFKQILKTVDSSSLSAPPGGGLVSSVIKKE